MLMIIAACVVILLIALIKLFEDRESAAPYSEEKPAVAVVKKTMGKPAEEPEQTPKQVNIYVFSAASRKRLCGCCDGENDMTATRCRICGQQIIN